MEERIKKEIEELQKVNETLFAKIASSDIYRELCDVQAKIAVLTSLLEAEKNP